MVGVDVSWNNGEVDWQAVADAGYSFAIVRCSYGLHEHDERFIENVNGARAAGLRVGAYHYGYALDAAEASQEAKNCREALVSLDLPLFYDMEDADGYKERHGYNFDNTMAICRTFIDEVGVDCGIYASYGWLSDYIDWKSLGCAVWNAEWGDVDDIEGMLWQYTDCAVIGGKAFDANVLRE